MKLRKFPGYDLLTEDAKARICNGAGAANDWKSAFIPNTLLGLDCTEAFNIHDYAYRVGMTWQDKEKADIDLLVNLFILIETGSWFLAYARRVRAVTYYSAVDSFGDDAYYVSSKSSRGIRQIKKESWRGTPQA